MDSGTANRKGTLAMFCVMWLVTASSITEPIAESASQCIWVLSESLSSLREVNFSRASNPFMESHAVPAQSSAKAANRNDHAQPRLVRSNAGSNSSGKPRSASSEAKFDSTQRREGSAVRKSLHVHA